MMNSPDRLTGLMDLLNQEIAAYQSLLQDMRQEWECLKKDDPPALSSILQAKTVHIAHIREIRESVDEMLSRLRTDSTSPSPKTILDLIPFLSLSQAGQIGRYQEKINGLREQIVRVNERNKHFVQEVLDYLKGLFSLLTSTIQEEPVYLKDGRKVSPAVSASWMSKEV
jgi:hypothetical protein